MVSTELESRILAAVPPHSVRPWPLPRGESAFVAGLRARIEAAGDAAAREREVERALRELRERGTPLTEPGDEPGTARFTFFWAGEAPHGVVLHLNRVSDMIDPADTLLQPIGGSRLHAITLLLPEDWLGSYLFAPLPAPLGPPLLHRGVDRAALGLLAAAASADPWAREQAPGKGLPGREGEAGPPLAIARGPAAPGLALQRAARRRPAAARTVRSPANGARLPLAVWSHPEAGPASPAVLLADGEVWGEQFPLAGELDRRIGAGGLEPLHLLFLASGGARQRILDYTAPAEESERLLAEVREAVGPQIAGPLVAAGQSLGGLFALQCASRHPGSVAAAVAQSPSLWWPSPLPGRGSPPVAPRAGWFEEHAARAAAGAGSAPVLLQGGACEWGLVERIRDAAALLRVQGALIDYREVPGGHDVAWWQALLPDAIVAAVRAAGRVGVGTR
ncbi:MAG: alpha/beta hydrolase-fold protein [Pseudoclavibacter sp.]|nr:alpha/beta hydrolase-fold protein [Pseudoclavibacter sp.]